MTHRLKSDKPVILIYNEYFVPGFIAGGPIVSVYNLARLLQDKYDVKIVCRNRDGGLSKLTYENVTTGKWSKLAGTSVEVFYASEKDLKVNKVMQQITLVNPDYIYLNSIFNFKFSILPMVAIVRLKFNLSNVIVNPRGEVNPGALAIKSARKKVFIQVIKAMGTHKKVTWNPTNKSELSELINTFGEHLKYKVMSNIPRQTDECWVPSVRYKYNRIVYLSRVDRIKNIELFLEAVRDVDEEILLDIYGPITGSKYWEDISVLIENMPKNILVSYKGEVRPDHVLSVLKDYDYFVLPSKGENFGHAIMDALSAGLPVLISDKTPWKPEEGGFGFDLPIDDVIIWTRTIKKMISASEKVYNEWSKNAYEKAMKVATDPKYLKDAKELFPILIRSNGE